ncbi:hypothetical protein Bbelb_349480 [Branchiostoma belcheri]|nr:hypothetical protein Bbelb_349480 [Branchiostoma belcheri]
MAMRKVLKNILHYVGEDPETYAASVQSASHDRYGTNGERQHRGEAEETTANRTGRRWTTSSDFSLLAVVRFSLNPIPTDAEPTHSPVSTSTPTPSSPGALLPVPKKRRLAASPRKPSARIKTAKDEMKIKLASSIVKHLENLLVLRALQRRTALIIVKQSSGGTQVFVIVHGKALVECRSVVEGFVSLIGALYCFQQPHPACIAPAMVFIEHHLLKDPNVNRADLISSFLKTYTKYESFRNGSDSGSETDMIRYTEKILIPYMDSQRLGLAADYPGLAIFDVFKAHRNLA